MKFYFTYGQTDTQPYKGGWTEVIVDDDEANVAMNAAINAFCQYHPCKSANIINCAFIYTEEAFMKTSMGQTGSSFGIGCREIITHTRQILKGDRND